MKQMNAKDILDGLRQAREAASSSSVFEALRLSERLVAKTYPNRLVLIDNDSLVSLAEKQHRLDAESEAAIFTNVEELYITDEEGE